MTDVLRERGARSDAAGAEPAGAAGRGRWRQLDVARAVVVGGLTFFHAAMIFEPHANWYVQSRHTSPAATAFAGFASIWAMPLLFVVAGVGTWHALRRRSTRAFVRARALRLLPPLVAGVVLVAPISVWFRHRADPSLRGSNVDFVRRFFDVRLDAGAFPFVVQPASRTGLFQVGHLWFVVLLLAFTLLFLPLLAWLRGPRGARALERLAVASTLRGVVLLPALLLAAINGLLGMQRTISAWNQWAYAVFFLGGAALASDERVRRTVRAHVAAALTLLVLVAGVGAATIRPDLRGLDVFTASDPSSVAFRVVFSVSGWLVVVAIVGALVPTRPVGEPGRVARWVNEAVLPVYVLHQPVVVAVGFVVVGWQLPGVVAYLLIACTSFVAVLALHELAIRRVPRARHLFGLPPRDRPPPASQPMGAPA